MLNERMSKLGDEPSAIRELFMWGLQRKKVVGDDKVYDFSIGNPSVPAPEQVKACILKHMNDDPVALHSYSTAAGIEQVRNTLADFITRTYDFKASGSNVFLTHGASGALAASFCAVTLPGEEVIVPAPYFPEYKTWIDTAGATLVPVSCDRKSFQLDFNEIEKAINEKTSAFVLNSPNNPTGAVYPREDLEKLADILESKEKQFGTKIYLICDEPYREITYGAEVPWVPSIYSRTIVCNSLSKTLSLPGERIGYAYVSDTMENARDVYVAITGAARALGHICAPVLFQHILADCIDVPTDVTPYAENRALLTEMLDDLGYEYAEPQGAFYLWMKALEPSAQSFSDKARELDLLIVPSESFGAEGWIRLSYCIAKETIINSKPAFEKLKALYE